MNTYETRKAHLRQHPRRWLITGVAGFIGSHLLEALLKHDQHVIGFDNFSTGDRHNLNEVLSLVTAEQWKRFVMFQGDVTDFEACRRACEGIDYVLHHAAVGSVPDSIAEPLHAHAVNATGFVNVLTAAEHGRVRRFVYASSSAVYGDDPSPVKIETSIGQCLSPYAVTKRTNELYAQVFTRCYGVETIGLRYFNVFGARQNPNGPYAAVIPNWIRGMIRGDPIAINGDGHTTRDFCYVSDVVQANILAATHAEPLELDPVINIGCGRRTTLNELFETVRGQLLPSCPSLRILQPVFREFRAGDVRHSHANIEVARGTLGYCPEYTLVEGLNAALAWYQKNLF